MAYSNQNAAGSPGDTAVVAGTGAKRMVRYSPHYITGLGDGSNVVVKQKVRNPPPRQDDDYVYESYLRHGLKNRKHPNKNRYPFQQRTKDDDPPSRIAPASSSWSNFFYNTNSHFNHNNLGPAAEYDAVDTAAAPWQLSAFALLGAVVLLSALFLHVLAETSSADTTSSHARQRHHRRTASSSRPPSQSSAASSRTTSRKEKVKDDDDSNSETYWQYYEDISLIGRRSDHTHITGGGSTATTADTASPQPILQPQHHHQQQQQQPHPTLYFPHHQPQGSRLLRRVDRAGQNSGSSSYNSSHRPYHLNPAPYMAGTGTSPLGPATRTTKTVSPQASFSSTTAAARTTTTTTPKMRAPSSNSLTPNNRPMPSSKSPRPPPPLQQQQQPHVLTPPPAYKAPRRPAPPVNLLPKPEVGINSFLPSDSEMDDSNNSSSHHSSQHRRMMMMSSTTARPAPPMDRGGSSGGGGKLGSNHSTRSLLRGGSHAETRRKLPTVESVGALDPSDSDGSSLGDPSMWSFHSRKEEDNENDDNNTEPISATSSYVHVEQETPRQGNRKGTTNVSSPSHAINHNHNNNMPVLPTLRKGSSQRRLQTSQHQQQQALPPPPPPPPPKQQQQRPYSPPGKIVDDRPPPSISLEDLSELLESGNLPPRFHSNHSTPVPNSHQPPSCPPSPTDNLGESAASFYLDSPVQVNDNEVSSMGSHTEHATNDPRFNIEHVRNRLTDGTNAAAALQAAIDFSELKLVEVIGGGGFGQVWKATWRSTPVAVKVLTGSAQSQKVPRSVLEEFAAEINLLRGMRHPNICLYMGACLQPPNRAIITELAANGSLWDALRLPLTPPYRAAGRPPGGLSDQEAWPPILYQPDPRHGMPPSVVAARRTAATSSSTKTTPPIPEGQWPWVLVKRVACGTARGMAYLHSGVPPVLHRDLKSANILLDESYTPKVCDFGLSRLQSSTNSSMTGNCGTVQWMAPEVLANQKYNEKADVFSYGIILWELLTRTCPYEGMGAVQCALSVLNKDNRPTIPQWCPPFLQALIRACWKTDPKDRPTFAQILAAFESMP